MCKHFFKVIKTYPNRKLPPQGDSSFKAWVPQNKKKTANWWNYWPIAQIFQIKRDILKLFRIQVSREYLRTLKNCSAINAIILCSKREQQNTTRFWGLFWGFDKYDWRKRKILAGHWSYYFSTFVVFFLNGVYVVLVLENFLFSNFHSFLIPTPEQPTIDSMSFAIFLSIYTFSSSTHENTFHQSTSSPNYSQFSE